MSQRRTVSKQSEGQEHIHIIYFVFVNQKRKNIINIQKKRELGACAKAEIKGTAELMRLAIGGGSRRASRKSPCQRRMG